MTIIYLLIPLSLILGAAAIAAFFWAVRSGQFDDMHTPALKILDDDKVAAPKERLINPTANHKED